VARAIRRALPVAVAERVELLDVANGEPGLGGDPAPQPELERRVSVRVQETGGQGLHAVTRLVRREDARLVGRHRDDDRVEAQGQPAGHPQMMPQTPELSGRPATRQHRHEPGIRQGIRWRRRREPAELQVSPHRNLVTPDGLA
jgi:hypothetical protein